MIPLFKEGAVRWLSGVKAEALCRTRDPWRRPRAQPATRAPDLPILRRVGRRIRAKKVASPFWQEFLARRNAFCIQKTSFRPQNPRGLGGRSRRHPCPRLATRPLSGIARFMILPWLAHGCAPTLASNRSTMKSPTVRLVVALRKSWVVKRGLRPALRRDFLRTRWRDHLRRGGTTTSGPSCGKPRPSSGCGSSDGTGGRTTSGSGTGVGWPG